MTKYIKHAYLMVIGLVLALGLGLGCERAEFEGFRMPELPPMPKVEPEGEEAKEAELEEVEPGPPLTLVSWPGRDGRHTFGLTWLGGEEAIALREKPDDEAPEAGKVSLLDGGEIDWRDTRVTVTIPRVYRTSEPVVYVGSIYDPQEELAIDEEVTISWAPGEVLRFYGDAGEGQCYVGKEDAFFITDCPPIGEQFERLLPKELDDEVALPWAPVESQWWVLVNEAGKRGWWRVDETLVDVRAIPMGD